MDRGTRGNKTKVQQVHVANFEHWTYLSQRVKVPLFSLIIAQSITKGNLMIACKLVGVHLKGWNISFTLYPL